MPNYLRLSPPYLRLNILTSKTDIHYLPPIPMYYYFYWLLCFEKHHVRLQNFLRLLNTKKLHSTSFCTRGQPILCRNKYWHLYQFMLFCSFILRHRHYQLANPGATVMCLSAPDSKLFDSNERSPCGDVRDVAPKPANFLCLLMVSIYKNFCLFFPPNIPLVWHCLNIRHHPPHKSGIAIVSNTVIK